MSSATLRSAAALGVFLVLVALTALFGAQFQPGDWYAALQKPPLNPPDWIFGPVWSALYLAIAIAAWLVWNAPAKATLPLVLWCAQLALNAAWSLFFFGLQRPGMALMEIGVLLVAMLATTIAFSRASALAAALFVPYLGWVAFAAYLNAGIWYLNR